MTDYAALARTLVTDEDPGFLARLAASPVAALSGRGIGVVKFAGYQEPDCSCDGIFHRGPPPVIGYLPTPGSRREAFTLVHEFGHFAVRNNGEVLSELADTDADGGKMAEERVCDALAGMVLVPDDAVDGTLAGGPPMAEHVASLYSTSHGSREACAVRLAERIPNVGYVVLADPVTKTIRFASPSPSTRYPWRRGTVLPDRHPLWRAASTGRYRGQGPVVWPSGNRQELWIDAVSGERLVHAVFTEHRHWNDSTLSILDGGVSPARGTSYRGACGHCGHSKWGYRLHEPCQETWCQICNRCGCGAPAKLDSETRACSLCGMTKRVHLFATGSYRCRDCE